MSFRTKRGTLYLNFAAPPLYLIFVTPPLYLTFAGPPLYLNFAAPSLYLTFATPPFYFKSAEPPLYLNFAAPLILNFPPPFSNPAPLSLYLRLNLYHEICICFSSRIPFFPLRSDPSQKSGSRSQYQLIRFCQKELEKSDRDRCGYSRKKICSKTGRWQ